MALVNPFSQVSVPMILGDGWMGDNGFTMAHFQEQAKYIFEQEATRDNSARCRSSPAGYERLSLTGSAGELGRRHGLRASWLLEEVARAPQL